jgi:hypothetical protein
LRRWRAKRAINHAIRRLARSSDATSKILVDREERLVPRPLRDRIGNHADTLTQRGVLFEEIDALILRDRLANIARQRPAEGLVFARLCDQVGRAPAGR